MLYGFEGGRLGINLAYWVVVCSKKESGVSLDSVKNHPKIHYFSKNIASVWDRKFMLHRASLLLFCKQIKLSYGTIELCHLSKLIIR